MKRFLLFFVATCFMFSATVAQISVWDGTNTVWTNGSGTQANPYLIENAAQLAYLAVYVNNGTNANAQSIVGSGKYWKLTANIDLNSRQWTPIGNNDGYGDGYIFGGNFDGDGHTVANLATDGEWYRVGLFGSMDGGSVKNIGIAGTSSISSTAHCNVGAIVGYANNITITNCYNTGNIFNDKLDCVGGIVGSGNGLTISNCYNTGNIGSPELNPYCGGIIGYAGITTTINNCYNTGNIYTTNGTAPYTAGIVANSGSELKINNCYNTGNVSTQGHAAGITTSNGVINNCYNTGNIYSSYSYSDYADAIALYAANVNNCYYLEGSAVDAGGGVSKSENEMKTQPFVNLLNSGTTPNNAYTQDVVPVNNGFPILTWQTDDNVGIVETLLSNINVYPNPVNYELTITNYELGIENYSIVNMTGQVVMQGKLQGETTTINVSSLPNGVYFIKAGNMEGKFMKN